MHGVNMERNAFQKLIEWKNSKKRKPLIIQGARQVGKTWLMKEFGKREYKKVVYVSFDRNKKLKNIFSETVETDVLISALELSSNINIEPNNTLIILDEIQACPDALTTLKYFYENAPEYHIIVAGSLLGVALNSDTGFPVGKVDFMTLYPLSFFEFLSAIGESQYRNILEEKKFKLITPFADKLIYLLKHYYYIGGMPEVVQDYIDNKNYNNIRKLQENILNSYEQDFSKHTSSAMAERIKYLWLSISSQLAKENKKFIYCAIKQGAKAREYEEAINWLRDSGLIYKVNRISKPELPIRAYEDLSAFKLYVLDVGLLGALANLSPQTIIDGDKIFTEFKGALTEQYVLQQLKNKPNKSINYWTSRSNVAEIDFILQKDNNVIPIEVKSSENLKAKSLTQYRKNFSPKYSVRTSLAQYKVDNDLYNIPLYMVEMLEKLL